MEIVIVLVFSHSTRQVSMNMCDESEQNVSDERIATEKILRKQWNTDNNSTESDAYTQ